MGVTRRRLLKAAAIGSVLGGVAGGGPAALAAGPITIGVLIPGSITDKGWMESGYDGMIAAEKKFGAKIKVNYIENVQFADMDQALVQLASTHAMVIGVGGQTQ
ncbi:MAG: BMP family ABC transporter substrate-binding protein, partial [Acetobacteraceae bacterium]